MNFRKTWIIQKKAKGSWLWSEGRAEKGRTWKKLSRHQCHRVAYEVRIASLLRDSQLLSSLSSKTENQSLINGIKPVFRTIFKCTLIESNTLSYVAGKLIAWFHPFFQHCAVLRRTVKENVGVTAAFKLSALLHPVLVFCNFNVSQFLIY